MENTIKTWDKLAQQYQDKFMDLDIYNDSYDLFNEAVANDDASILEIGCGPGNITKYLLTKNPNYEILATDVAPNMIELAKITNPSAEFAVLDARAISQANRKFDAVICGFCMPYLSKEDCIQLIKDSDALLNDNGIFYFSTIEGSYEQSEMQNSSDGQHTLFVYYHQADYLEKVLKECQFEIVHLLRIRYEKSKDVFDTHLIYIVRK